MLRTLRLSRPRRDGRVAQHGLPRRALPAAQGEAAIRGARSSPCTPTCFTPALVSASHLRPHESPHLYHHRRQARAPPGEGPEAKKRMFLGSFATAVEAAVCFAKHVEQQGGMRGRFVRGEGGEEGEEEESEEEEGEEEEGEEEGGEEEGEEEEGEEEVEAEEAGEGEEGAEEVEGVGGRYALVAKYEEQEQREDNEQDEHASATRAARVAGQQAKPEKHKAGGGRGMGSLEGLAAAANSFRREAVGAAGAVGGSAGTNASHGGGGGGGGESCPCSSSLMSDVAMEEVCRRCGGDTEEDNDLLLCDTPGCGASYHMWCLEPPLASVPEGDWFCPDCDPHEPDMPPPRPMQPPMLPPIRKAPQLVGRLLDAPSSWKHHSSPSLPPGARATGSS